MLESQVKRHKSAERRAADAGVLRPGKRPIFAFHKRLHFLDEKFCVTVRAPAAKLWRSEERRVGKECSSRWAPYRKKKQSLRRQLRGVRQLRQYPPRHIGRG